MRHQLAIAIISLLITPLAAAQRTIENIAYHADAPTKYAAERCTLDLQIPTDAENFPTIVFFHGGGLEGGNKYFPEELTGRGYAIATVNYRLSPKAKAPAYIEDAAAAVAWVVRNIEQHGGDPTKVIVTGYSAGAYLTSMIGLDKSYLEAHDVNADDLAALIPVSGFAITHMTPRKERGIPADRPIIDDLAPLYHIRADAPPICLITGDYKKDMLMRAEENQYLAAMLEHVGHPDVTLVVVPGADHGTVWREAWTAGGYDFLDRILKRPRTDTAQPVQPASNP